MSDTLHIPDPRDPAVSSSVNRPASPAPDSDRTVDCGEAAIVLPKWKAFPANEAINPLDRRLIRNAYGVGIDQKDLIFGDRIIRWDAAGHPQFLYDTSQIVAEIRLPDQTLLIDGSLFKREVLKLASTKGAGPHEKSALDLVDVLLGLSRRATQIFSPAPQLVASPGFFHMGEFKAPYQAQAQLPEQVGAYMQSLPPSLGREWFIRTRMGLMVDERHVSSFLRGFSFTPGQKGSEDPAERLASCVSDHPMFVYGSSGFRSGLLLRGVDCSFPLPGLDGIEENAFSMLEYVHAEDPAFSQKPWGLHLLNVGGRQQHRLVKSIGQGALRFLFPEKEALFALLLDGREYMIRGHAWRRFVQRAAYSTTIRGLVPNDLTCLRDYALALAKSIHAGQWVDDQYWLQLPRSVRRSILFHRRGGTKTTVRRLGTWVFLFGDDSWLMTCYDCAQARIGASRHRR